MSVIGWVLILLLAMAGCAGLLWHAALWLLTPHPRPRCVKVYLPDQHSAEQVMRYARACRRPEEQVILLSGTLEESERLLCTQLGGTVSCTPTELEQMFETLLQSENT